MAVVTGVLPYDLDNLLGGAARVLVTDVDATDPGVPPDISDVIFLESADDYAAKTGWLDVGATTEGTSYSRDISTEGFEIEQSRSAVFEEVTDITRQISVSMGEIQPEMLRIVENAGDATTVTAAAGKSAQKVMAFGSFPSLDIRRVAFIAMRNKQSGEVIESDAVTKRGRFVMVCLYQASIAADTSEIQVAKANLTSAPVTFTAFPDDTQDQGEEFGAWYFEDAGTIT